MAARIVLMRALCLQADLARRMLVFVMAVMMNGRDVLAASLHFKLLVQVRKGAWGFSSPAIIITYHKNFPTVITSTTIISSITIITSFCKSFLREDQRQLGLLTPLLVSPVALTIPLVSALRLAPNTGLLSMNLRYHSMSR